MLYLHCGWPRTGTTSLQAALFAHRGNLAEAGIVYPEEWLSHESPTHHGLFELLRALYSSGGSLDEFRAFLDLHSDQDVLFSAEAITSWLLAPARHGVLLDLLAAAREVVPVRCIWTLRRLDDGLQSLYLRRLAYAFELQLPDQHFAKIGDLDEFFAGVVRAGEAATEVAYVKYEPTGAHNEELLRTFGIPAEVQSGVRRHLSSNRRLNSSLTHKQAVALRYLEALSTRVGVELSWVALRDAFLDGELTFEDDRRCVLLDGDASRALHVRTLAAAERQGFTPYVEFFGDAEVEPSSAVRLHPDVITDQDLERMVFYLRAAVPA